MSEPDALIADVAALADATARARAAGVAALDTEFVWERTYFPRLGLIQLAWPEGDGPDDVAVALLDPTALPTLAPLGDLLADPEVEKVLHDAGQDLTILRRASGGEPRRIFDTQRAAGFVGLPSTLSLQDLLRETVGVEIAKGEQRTDWLRRPLSPAQLVYARADVRHLPEVRRRLLDRAHVRGRAAWIAEEMQRYEAPDLYTEVDPMEQHERVKVGTKLSPEQRAVLRELAAWREQEARRADRPRRCLLADDAISELARRMPADRAALARLGLPEGLVRHHADALLDAVARGRAVAPSERPHRPPPGPDEDRLAVRTQLLQALLAGRGARQGVDPGLVASKSDLRALVDDGPHADPEAHPLLRGWRRAFIGYDLLALLDGRASVMLDPEDGWPRFRAMD
jgi:ribonuclease D